MNSVVLSSLLVVMLAIVVSAQTSCSASITVAPRASSSWTDGITQYQIYDISVTNSGTCAITSIVGFFSGGSGRITEGWNYAITSGLITGFGGVLRVGQSYTGSGFVLANSSSPTLTINMPGCDSSCTQLTTPSPSTPSPSTPSPSTPSPSTPSPSTPSPTPSPSTPSPSTPSPSTPYPSTTLAPGVRACSGATAQIVRDNNVWQDAQGRNTSVYRVVLTNGDTCPLIDYTISLSFMPGVLVSNWNLQSVTGGGYLVQGFGQSLAPGQTYSGAGLIVAGAPQGMVTATPVSTHCKC